MTLWSGVGLSARPPYYSHLIEGAKNNILSPNIQWLEILIDNFRVKESLARESLDELASFYPVVFHGVGLSIASSEPFLQKYLKEIYDLIKEYQPLCYTEHLCFVDYKNHSFHDLLPLPLNKKTLNHLVSKVDYVQQFLGQSIALENISQYLTYQDDEMPLWSFLNSLCESTQCGLLVDLNNLIVNEKNLQLNASEFLKNINPKFVKQYHCAGFTQLQNGILLDSHACPMDDELLLHYEYALKKIGDLPICLEWDDQLPAFSVIQNELNRIVHVKNSFLNKSIASLRESEL